MALVLLDQQSDLAQPANLVPGRVAMPCGSSADCDAMKPPICNDRIRLHYQTYLQALDADPKTIDAKLAILTLWDNVTSNAAYWDATVAHVQAFRSHLRSHVSEQTGERYSNSAILHHNVHMHGFFAWLSKRSEFGEINQEVVKCLATPYGLRGVGRLVDEKPVYEVGDYERTIKAMPTGTLVDRADRAILSLFLLTGIRFSALITLRLKHVQVDRRCIDQPADEVKVKNGKSQTTFFFPISDIAESAFLNYFAELKSFGHPENALLFPRSRVLQELEGPRQLTAFCNQSIRAEGGIRNLVRSALGRIGLPYTNPHQIRHTIAQHYSALPLTEEDRLAVEINFGHEPSSTINRYYAKPTTEKRGAIIRALATRVNGDLSKVTADELFAELKRRMG